LTIDHEGNAAGDSAVRRLGTSEELCYILHRVKNSQRLEYTSAISSIGCVASDPKVRIFGTPEEIVLQWFESGSPGGNCVAMV
jgi:hypothetical protein